MLEKLPLMPMTYQVAMISQSAVGKYATPTSGAPLTLIRGWPPSMTMTAEAIQVASRQLLAKVTVLADHRRHVSSRFYQGCIHIHLHVSALLIKKFFLGRHLRQGLGKRMVPIIS
jgi:hypothetical protein